MPDLLVRSFAPFLLAFQPCFTQPSFSSFWALTCAWILCSGRRSLTRVIQSGQLGRFKHFCSFHRFFSQARWNLDDLGHCVFQLLLPFCPEILTGAVDDTLARKSGRHIWGADMHHDPLRSTQKRPFFSFGHSWVVFSLHVSFAFAPGKVWALPILVRLYRKRKKSILAPGRSGKPERKQTGQAAAKQYRTRPQLALEMIQTVARWLGPRKLRVLGDSEYAGGSISRHLPANTESDTPRGAGGLMSWTASKAVGPGVQASRVARLNGCSELSACSIRHILLADVVADLLQFEPDGGYGVTASPEMLAGEVSFLAVHSSNRDGALAFQEPDHGSYRVLGWNGDAHVHVVWHQVSLNDLALLLPSQRVENRTQLSTDLAKDGLPPSLGHKHDVVLAVPFRMG
jgi:hypothetical protein